MPRSFAFAEWAPPWWSGEALPVVGQGVSFVVGENTRVLANLNRPGAWDGQVPGLLRSPLGAGALLAYAFDLPRSILLCRQGDPAKAEVHPPDDCARPLYMACDLGTHQAAWLPFADLLARSLVDLIRAHTPPGTAPMPLLWHLPGDAPSVLLYSGDEDYAPVAANDEELETVSSFGGRMDLYIIPEATHSTPVDVKRYTQRHDLGVHADIRPLDGKPVAERLACLERQIKLFTETYGIKPTTLRQHCLAWAGYLEPIELYERLGIRMESNYYNFGYRHDRAPGIYAPFGGAMPMRFCDPSAPGKGRLLEVFQQHGHLMDDCWFAPRSSDYSHRVGPRAFEGVAARIFDDATQRFHTPLGTCMHPGNWVKFSRDHGTALLREANQRGVPIWSFTQWCDWWDARDTWRIEAWEWDGTTLRCELRGTRAVEGLSVMLPGRWRVAGGEEVARYREVWTRVPLPGDQTQASFTTSRL
jgi:hypothetical protein